MFDNELFVNESNNLELKDIIVRDIVPINEYTFFELDNRQKFLTNGFDLYDVSLYDIVLDVFRIGNRICAVASRFSSLLLIDLQTGEELFKDNKACHISKQDERTIKVLKHPGAGDMEIYDIVTRKYLQIPENYEYEWSLGNDLYVYVEKNDYGTTSENIKGFYDRKRCVINSDSKMLLKDIEGWIYSSENHLIIIKDKSLSIVGLNENQELNIKTVEKSIIAKPVYYKDKIVIIEENVIKIFSFSLLLLDEIKVDGIQEVLDLELIDDTLKLFVPCMTEDIAKRRHIFINLKNKKIISHSYIETLPYWKPNVYIGEDNLEDDDNEVKQYYFYNKEFNLIRKIIASSYKSLSSENENLFLIKEKTNLGTENTLFNTDTNVMKDINYDFVQYKSSVPYGYAVNFEKGVIDFLNENFEVVFPNLDYKKFDLSLQKNGFSYFIINDYICIKKHFIDGFGYRQCRTILIKNNGDIILDSLEDKCYLIGEAIQIINNGESKFMNTRTGDIGVLKLRGAVNEDGKIDFRKLTDFNSSFKIDCCDNLKIGESCSKVKRLEINEWIDNYL